MLIFCKVVDWNDSSCNPDFISLYLHPFTVDNKDNAIKVKTSKQTKKHLKKRKESFSLFYFQILS